MKHPLYYIQKGETTLKQLTDKFGIDEMVWLRYHASMCTLDEVIYPNKVKGKIPAGVTRIFLHPDLWEKEKELNKISITESTTKKLANKSVSKNSIYGVFYLIQNYNNRYFVELISTRYKITYNIQISFLEITSDDLYSFSIHRTDFRLNEQPVDLMLYELADKMISSLYPISIVINNKDRKVVEVLNHQDILKRANSILDSLNNYYKGEFAEKYIDNFRSHVKNSNIVKRIINSDLFSNLFFLPLQGYYTDTQLKSSYLFQFRNYDEELLNLTMNLASTYDRNGLLCVYIESENNSKYNLQARYRLYPDDHTISDIVGSLNINDNVKNTTEKIQFKIYHTNPSERIVKRKLMEL